MPETSITRAVDELRTAMSVILTNSTHSSLDQRVHRFVGDSIKNAITLLGTGTSVVYCKICHQIITVEDLDTISDLADSGKYPSRLTASEEYCPRCIVKRGA